jgi:hypothetical protein
MRCEPRFVAARITGRVLLAVVLSLTACDGSSDDPAGPDPPGNGPPAPASVVKAVAISPRGFPQDFSRLIEFFGEAAALPDAGVMWNGAWRDDVQQGSDAGTPPAAATLTAQQAAARDFAAILVFGWRAGDQLFIRVPSNPANDWSNPQAAELYARVVADFAAAHRPRFLFLGNESEEYYATNPADYARWVQVYEQSYDRVKAASPQTHVGPIFQYERLAGIGGLAGFTTPHWEALTAHDLAKIDIVGITLYAFLAHTTPAAVPDNYLAPLLARIGTKPIAITETGWPAETAPGFDPPWQTSEAHQLTFINTLSRILATRDVKLVTWLFLHPMAPPPGDPQLEWHIFHSISLRNAAGGERPVYQAWRNFTPRGDERSSPVVAAPQLSHFRRLRQVLVPAGDEQRVGILELRVRIRNGDHLLEEHVVHRDHEDAVPARQLELAQRPADPARRHGHLLNAEIIGQAHVVDDARAHDAGGETDARLALRKDGLGDAELVHHARVVRRDDLDVDLANADIAQRERGQDTRGDVVARAHDGGIRADDADALQHRSRLAVADRRVRDPRRNAIDGFFRDVERDDVVSHRVQRLGDARAEVAQADYHESFHVPPVVILRPHLRARSGIPGRPSAGRVRSPRRT